MQRSVLLELADQAAARSMATLFEAEQWLGNVAEMHGYGIADTAELRIHAAMVQQLEAIRLTLAASIAED